MRNLKRVLSLALALVMVLGMMVIGTSAATFTDAEEITYTEAVDVMSAIGILKGYEAADGTFTFNPNGTLNRQEAAKILAYVCLGSDADDYLTGSAAAFDDVAVTSWAAKYIAFCKNAKIIDGVGDNKFNPAGTLKTVEFTKMLLAALGIDGTFTGSGWDANVKAAAEAAGLDVIEIDHSEITREEACEMALAAMKWTDETKAYGLYSSDTDELLKVYTDAIDAYFAAVAMDGAAYVDIITNDGYLLNTVYGVTWTPSTDDFGRTANVYTNDAAWKAPMVYVTATAAKVYTDKVTAKTVAADLDGYKADGFKMTYEIEDDTMTVNVVVDGEADPLVAVEGTVAGAIASLTGDNKTVEIYANYKKEITKIVVVESHYDYIAEVTKADAEKEIEASVTLGGDEDLTFKTDAFAQYDIVVYTYANGKVQTLTLAESFTGTMTTYNSDGEFTINGEVYEVAANGGVAGFDETVVIAEMGEEQVYYVGQNDKLIYCEDPAGAAPVVITDYILVNNSNVKTTYTDWPTESISASTAQVAGILSDGTAGVFDLAVSKAATGANKGHFVTKIGGVETVVEAANADDADTTIADINGIYTYTLDGSTITLVKKLATLDNTDEKNVVETVAVSGITASTAEDDGVIFNSETVFILKNAQNKLVVKTGIAALEDTTVAGDAVVNVTYNAKAGTYTNVAAVVYAPGVTFDAATSAVDTADYIYVDGTYVVTADTDGSSVYTYTGVKADGTKISVIGEDDQVGAGIYNFNAKGEIQAVNGAALLAANAVIVADAEVGTIAGTSVKLDNTFRTIDATTKIVVVAKDAALEKGATVTYVYNTNTNVVALVYVTAAAE